jgi:hypothetical protein
LQHSSHVDFCGWQGAILLSLSNIVGVGIAMIGYRKWPATIVRRQAAVIFTAGGSGTALSAKATTSSIPIVFVSGTDPVEAGLVSNFSRPDANLYGRAQPRCGC